MIDRYLMKGLLNLVEHQAGEYLLGQASRAAIWPTGANLSSTRVQHSTGGHDLLRGLPFGRTLSAVKKNFGWFHMYVVHQVVCFDWDVSRDEFRLKCLKDGLTCIAEQRMGGGRDPLRTLRKAAEGI